MFQVGKNLSITVKVLHISRQRRYAHDPIGNIAGKMATQ